MKKITALNETQRKLVENHFSVVEWIIKEHIRCSKGIVGLSYDDIFGEGCYWLCRAALSYNGSTLFKTYAKVVVRQGLIYYCRNTYGRYVKYPVIHIGDASPSDFKEELYPGPTDSSNEHIQVFEIINMLESVKTEYTGTALLGIEALILKVKGCSGTEIAYLYGVKPNLVGAWISRASKKLRENDRFVTAFAS